jgi:8-oxo-dGTP pyrophosphatase MutT (NUDIX family)
MPDSNTLPEFASGGLAPTARAVIEDQGRYLLAVHHYVNPANWGKWSIPGGRIDPRDPDPASALRRELREEFQATIEIRRFLGIYPYNGRQHHVFLARFCESEWVPNPDEILDARWFTWEEIGALHAAGRLLADFIYEAIRDSRAP